MPIKIPSDLLPDQQACQINAIRTMFHNITSEEVPITMEELKEIFEYRADGALYGKQYFRRLTERLHKLKLPFRPMTHNFNDISEVFPLVKSIPIPVYFEMSVLKSVEGKLPSEYHMNVGEGVYSTDNKHILLLVGYKDNGEELLFLDPVHQLPHLECGEITDESQLLKFRYREASQHMRLLKFFISPRYDGHLAKKFKKSFKRTSKTTTLTELSIW